VRQENEPEQLELDFGPKENGRKQGGRNETSDKGISK
jgi:hypothetical protein